MSHNLLILLIALCEVIGAQMICSAPTSYSIAGSYIVQADWNTVPGCKLIGTTANGGAEYTNIIVFRMGLTNGTAGARSIYLNQLTLVNVQLYFDDTVMPNVSHPFTFTMTGCVIIHTQAKWTRNIQFTSNFITAGSVFKIQNTTAHVTCEPENLFISIVFTRILSWSNVSFQVENCNFTFNSSIIVVDTNVILLGFGMVETKAFGHLLGSTNISFVGNTVNFYGQVGVAATPSAAVTFTACFLNQPLVYHDSAKLFMARNKISANNGAPPEQKLLVSFVGAFWASTTLAQLASLMLIETKMTGENCATVSLVISYGTLSLTDESTIFMANNSVTSTPNFTYTTSITIAIKCFAQTILSSGSAKIIFLNNEVVHLSQRVGTSQQTIAAIIWLGYWNGNSTLSVNNLYLYFGNNSVESRGPVPTGNVLAARSIIICRAALYFLNNTRLVVENNRIFADNQWPSINTLSNGAQLAVSGLAQLIGASLTVHDSCISVRGENYVIFMKGPSSFIATLLTIVHVSGKNASLYIQNATVSLTARQPDNYDTVLSVFEALSIVGDCQLNNESRILLERISLRLNSTLQGGGRFSLLTIRSTTLFSVQSSVMRILNSNLIGYLGTRNNSLEEFVTVVGILLMTNDTRAAMGTNASLVIEGNTVVIGHLNSIRSDSIPVAALLRVNVSNVWLASGTRIELAGSPSISVVNNYVDVREVNTVACSCFALEQAEVTLTGSAASDRQPIAVRLKRNQLISNQSNSATALVWAVGARTSSAAYPFISMCNNYLNGFIDESVRATGANGIFAGRGIECSTPSKTFSMSITPSASTSASTSPNCTSASASSSSSVSDTLFVSTSSSFGTSSSKSSSTSVTDTLSHSTSKEWSTNNSASASSSPSTSLDSSSSPASSSLSLSDLSFFSTSLFASSSETSGTTSRQVTSSQSYSLLVGCPTECGNVSVMGPAGIVGSGCGGVLPFSYWGSGDINRANVELLWEGSREAVGAQMSNLSSHSLSSFTSTPGHASLHIAVSYETEDQQFLPTEATIHIHFGCHRRGNSSGAVGVTIMLLPKPLPAPVLGAPNVEAAVAASLTGLLSGGWAAGDLQTLSALGLSACAKGSAKASGLGVRMIAPLAISDTCEGAVMGNFITLGAMGVIHCVVLVVFRMRKQKSILVAMDSAHFPALSLIIIAFLQNGFLVCGMDLIRSGRNALGYASVLWVMVMLVAFTLVAYRSCPRAYCPSMYGPLPKGVEVLAKVCLPVGHWDHTVLGSRMFSPVLGKYRYPSWALVIFNFSSFLASVPIASGTGSACVPLYALSLMLQLSFAAAVAFRRPYRTLINNVIQPTGLLVNAAIVVHYILLLDKSLVTGSAMDITIRSSLSVFVTIQTILSIARVVIALLPRLAPLALPALRPYLLTCQWEVVAWPHGKRVVTNFYFGTERLLLDTLPAFLEGNKVRRQVAVENNSTPLVVHVLQLDSEQLINLERKSDTSSKTSLTPSSHNREDDINYR